MTDGEQKELRRQGDGHVPLVDLSPGVVVGRLYYEWAVQRNEWYAPWYRARHAGIFDVLSAVAERLRRGGRLPADKLKEWASANYARAYVYQQRRGPLDMMQHRLRGRGGAWERVWEALTGQCAMGIGEPHKPWANFEEWERLDELVDAEPFLRWLETGEGSPWDREGKNT